MKIYVAAPWIHKSDAIKAGTRLEAAGHSVTSRWFLHEGSATDSAGTSSPIESIRHQSREDIADVLRADVLVVLNLAKSEGKAVETGIAIANNIPFISVGPRSNIFQSLGTEVEALEDVIEYLAQSVQE